MEKSLSREPESCQQSRPEKRYSKRLVNLMSSVAPEDHPHKLRSHTRLLSSSTRVPSTRKLGGSVSSRNPVNATESSGSLCGPQEEGARKADEDTVASGEDDDDERGESQKELLKSVTPSSSCSPPTNETKKQHEQAGLGGTASPKTTTHHKSAVCPLSKSPCLLEYEGERSGQSNNHREKEHRGDLIAGDCETRSSCSQRTDNGWPVYQGDVGVGVRSCELPVQPCTSSLATCTSDGDDDVDEKRAVKFPNRANPPHHDGKESGKERFSCESPCHAKSLSKSDCDSASKFEPFSEDEHHSASKPSRNEDEKGGERKGRDEKQKPLCQPLTAVMPEITRIEVGNEAGLTPPPPRVSVQVEARSNKCSRPNKKSGSRSRRSSAHNKPCGEVAVLRNKVQLDNSYNTRNTSGASETNSDKVGGDSVDSRKANIAPMLLMNNLPYMGELTFDTRPRRGRKPKKADICHLISKNYGIQFPVSYINLPNTGGVSIVPPLPITNPKSSSHSQHHSKRNVNTAAGSSHQSSSSSQFLPPPAFSNRDVSIVPIPSSWGAGGGGGASVLDKTCLATNSHLKSLSLAQQLISQQAISMFPLPVPPPTLHLSSHQASMGRKSEEEEDDQEGEYMDDSDHVKGSSSQWGNMDDIPLNLCLRDNTSPPNDSEPISLCKGNRGGSGEQTDVRWNKSVLLHGANAGASPRLSSAVAAAVHASFGKRNAVAASGEGGCNNNRFKSAKLSGRASSNSSNIYGSHTSSFRDGDEVSNLVNQQRRLCPTSSSTAGFSAPSYQQSSKSNNALRSLRSSSKVSTIPATAIFPVSSHVKGADCGSSSKISMSPVSTASATVVGGKLGGKQTTRKKRADVSSSSSSGLRGDISISGGSPCPNTSGSSPSLSSIGGTLFGQSTTGLNDAAEVSICKFKFTGGARPCLQEKKMLSVDSGGNFRFYTDKTSGPAAKVGKGQTQFPSCSSTSSASSASPVKGGLMSAADLCQHSSSEPECHFALSSLPKSAKSMSMCMSVPGNGNPPVQVMSSGVPVPSSSSKSRSPSRLSLPIGPSTSSSGNPIISISPTTEELQHLHLMDNQAQHQRSSSSVSPYHGEYSYSSSNSSSSDTSNANDNPKDASRSNRQSRSIGTSGTGGGGKMKMKRKRRTRKSLMREKLEKTFKEKGFLIQTQQLESAEGATYCKFRQLRKFTRYLFRSWKDYLPDHVKEISDNSAAGAAPAAIQSRPESAKSPESSCSIQHDSRCSTTPIVQTGEETANVQSMDLDTTADFQDDDGDDDDADTDDDDELDEEHEGMISEEDDNDNNNHAGDVIRVGMRMKGTESQKLENKREHNDGDDDEQIDSSPGQGLPPSAPTAITKSDDDDEEEELQVDS